MFIDHQPATPLPFELPMIRNESPDALAAYPGYALTEKQARKDIAAYVMGYYNESRPHQWNDGLPPAVRERQPNLLSGNA